MLVVVDENRQTPQDRLVALEKRYKRNVLQNQTAFYSLLIASIGASALPALLVQLGDPSSGWLKIVITVVAIIAAILSAIEAAVGARPRWLASRNARKSVTQLANTYAARTISDEVAMQRLNKIVEEYDAAVQASVS